MDESALEIVRDFIDNNLFEPEKNWPKQYFSERTYSRWAAFEILNRMMKESLKPPTHITGIFKQTPCEIITGFIVDMENCLNICDDKTVGFIFSIAKETAKEIGLLFV